MRTLLVLLLLAEPVSYAPKTKHLTVAECAKYMSRDDSDTCKQLYPEQSHPESDRHLKEGPTCAEDLRAGHLRFCQWYGGADIPDPCRKGFHTEQTHTTTLDGLPTGQTVCLQEQAR